MLDLGETLEKRKRMTLTRMPATIVALAVALGIVACSSASAPFECSPDHATITPDSAVLVVGDTVTLRASAISGTCLPSDTAPAQLRWLIQGGNDTSVIRVDSLSGLVTALNGGKKFVELLTVQTRRTLHGVPVTVVP